MKKIPKESFKHGFFPMNFILILLNLRQQQLRFHKHDYGIIGQMRCQGEEQFRKDEKSSHLQKSVWFSLGEKKEEVCILV